MNAGIALAAMGNIGLLACAAIDTAAVIAYWAKAHDDRHGRWWRTPFGLHLMCFMAAFAIVLDQSAVYLITTGQVIPHAAPPGRLDWFAWVRVTSFCTLIPAVLAWRLLIILRPPSRHLRRVVAGRHTTGQQCGPYPSGTSTYLPVPSRAGSWSHGCAAVVPGIPAGPCRQEWRQELSPEPVSQAACVAGAGALLPGALLLRAG